ncbi:MAG: hypothetical protein VX000_11310, partial [Myxococcota bacterium]|nr:hypothetical protein [Myxococcota bacterium]
GTRFGPFEGRFIALGSDAEQCHIVLPAELGVYPVHCWVTVEAGGAFVIQPAEREGYVYSHALGTPTVIGGAARLSSGQQFSLVSPDGPRFVVESGAAAAVPGLGMARQGIGGRQPTGRRAGRRLPNAGDMLDEVKRQVGVRLMTDGPFAQLGHLFHRARSGALFQPRYVVGALIALFGVLVTACSGLAALLHITS